MPPSPPVVSRKGLGAGWIVAIVVSVIFGVLLLISLAVPAYNRIQQKAQEIRNQNDPALKAPPPLTAEQQKALVQFGKDLAEAISKNDADRMMKMQDAEGLAARAFEKMTGMRNAANMRRGFVDGVQGREGGWMWNAMGNEVSLLRTRERLGFPAVLLRLKTVDGGVNYLDVIVRPDGAGFKAVDTFNYVLATTVSEESRQALLSMTAKSDGDALASMLGMGQADKDAPRHLKAIGDALREGKSEEVLRLYEALPVRLKTQRMFFIMRLQALTALSSTGDDKIDDDYKAALRAAPDILGKESTTDLLMVGLLFMENDFQGADECLQRVDKAIGGDPYLKCLRANARLMLKDYDGVITLADQAQKEEPTLSEPVDLRLSVHAERKDHKALVAELRAFKKNFGQILDRAALTDDATYNDFLASPEFLAWEKEIAAP